MLFAGNKEYDDEQWTNLTSYSWWWNNQSLITCFFLGILIDDKLFWREQVGFVCTNVYTMFLNFLYYSLIYPYFNLLWHCMDKYTKSDLEMPWCQNINNNHY